jgi:proteasome lid subunit RPN8/RPN11
MIQIPQSVYIQLRRHGESAYPDECCGILVGAVHGSAKAATAAIPVKNASPGNTRSHYEISPADLVHAERDARSAGYEILGFYHSHPDHPAHWSLTDLAEAHWLGCSYLITSIANGRATETRSFHLQGKREEDKHFEEEEIQIEDRPES